ncbi:MAG: hypothetical protein ACYC7E_04680 [Armatimonadota bacterium]
MMNTSDSEPQTTAPLNRDEAERLGRWTRSTGRQPGDPPPVKRALSGPLEHGIFAFRMLGEEEKVLFSEIIASFLDEFKLNHSVDFVQLELSGIYCLQLVRAIMAENWEAAERIDRLLRHHLDDLKVTKRAREGDGAVDARMSPMDIALSLLARAKARQAEEAAEAADAEASTEKTPETVQRTPGDDVETHA